MSAVIRFTACDQRDSFEKCDCNVLQKEWNDIKKRIRLGKILMCITCGQLSCKHHQVNRLTSSKFTCSWCRRNKTIISWIRKQRVFMV